MQPESVREVFQGRLISVEVQEWPAGEREIVHHPGACGVVAFTDSGELLLVRQMREAVREALLEIPAGILDRLGEDPSNCAARELLEETGHAARNIERLATIYTSPGFADERIHLFQARVADGDPEGQGEDGGRSRSDGARCGDRGDRGRYDQGRQDRRGHPASLAPDAAALAS